MNQRISHSATAWLWLWWVIASTASVMAAWYFSDATINVLKHIAGPVNEDHLTMPVLVVAVAVGQAVLQWLVLRHYFPRATQWIVATVAGWIVASGSLMIAASAGGILQEAVLRPETALYSELIIWGVGIGVIQWLVLRRHAARAGWWIPATVIGWLAVPLAIGPTLNNVIEMAALGAVPAAITGFVLIWLLRQPPHETLLLERRAI